MFDDSVTLEGLAGLETALFLLGGALFAAAVVMGVFSFALYKAGNRSPYAAIATSLALIGAFAVLVYAFGGEGRAETIPIASLAIGALAAALGQLSRKSEEEPVDETVVTPAAPESSEVEAPEPSVETADKE